MSVRHACLRFYWTAQALIAPGLEYSQNVYEDVLRRHTGDIGRWLDLGCGHQLLPSWRASQERELLGAARMPVGLDHDLASLKKHETIRFKIRGDISELPFADDAFDLVTSNMVFEHLQQPERQLEEIARILKPGGTLIFHTPNALGYITLVVRLIPAPLRVKLVGFLDGRGEEDIYPAYYRINSPRSIEHSAVAAGLAIRSLRLIVSSAALVMIPPLVVLELVLIRVLMTRALRRFRTNIIAILEKPVH